jgi:DNA-binding NtrC family response regulator
MKPDKVLLGKRLLIVDDEKDVLELLIELLRVCKIDVASSFNEAKGFLEENEYDLVVLDIMGVKGFDLLKLANKRNIPALMLTAHSLNEESLIKSMREGAAYFVPKEKMVEIATYASDVIEAKDRNTNPWTRWLKRLGSFFDATFTGPNWREQQKEYLEKIKSQGL